MGFVVVVSFATFRAGCHGRCVCVRERERRLFHSPSQHLLFMFRVAYAFLVFGVATSDCSPFIKFTAFLGCFQLAKNRILQQQQQQFYYYSVTLRNFTYYKSVFIRRPPPAPPLEWWPLLVVVDFSIQKQRTIERVNERPNWLFIWQRNTRVQSGLETRQQRESHSLR